MLSSFHCAYRMVLVRVEELACWRHLVYFILFKYSQKVLV